MIAMDQQTLSLSQQQLHLQQKKQPKQNQNQNQNQLHQKHPRYSFAEDRRPDSVSSQSGGPPACAAAAPAAPAAAAVTAPATVLESCESNLAPVSVRDMVRRYNSASELEQQKLMLQSQPLRRQSQFPLSIGRASFSNLNKFYAQPLVKRETSEEDNGKTATPMPMPTPTPLHSVGCRRCNSCKLYESCMRAPSLNTSDRHSSRHSTWRCNSSGGESEHSASPAFAGDSVTRQCSLCDFGEAQKELPSSSFRQTLPSSTAPSVRLPSVLKERATRRSSLSDSVEEINGQPVEASYQSKTTIAKTASGVRITIDIFFDQDQNVSPNDVIGSRVETDIPQSRILAEFQQQTKQSCVN